MRHCSPAGLQTDCAAERMRRQPTFPTPTFLSSIARR